MKYKFDATPLLFVALLLVVSVLVYAIVNWVVMYILDVLPIPHKTIIIVSGIILLSLLTCKMCIKKTDDDKPDKKKVKP